MIILACDSKVQQIWVDVIGEFFAPARRPSRN